MTIAIGIDIGSVSIKAAVVATGEDRHFVLPLGGIKGFSVYTLPEERNTSIVLSDYRRIKGSPLDVVEDVLASIRPLLQEKPAFMVFTGNGGKLAAKQYDAPVINEFTALVEAVNLCYPDVRTIMEMGGETSKYILLDRIAHSDSLSIIDYGTNGDCAAGTGAFIDQQASRLKFRIEDVGDIVMKASKTAQIAGRCSVFAKSDMIHAQQRGYQPEEVLKGLCNAVTRNFKGVISRGKKMIPPVIFIGGVAQNKGMLQAICNVFDLDERDISVPELMCWLGAIGAAVRVINDESRRDGAGRVSGSVEEDVFPHTDRLTMENVVLLREKIIPRDIHDTREKIPAYLGVDIGSVSTNLVVIDPEGRVLKEIYTQTKARPIEVVGDGLKEIAHEIGNRIDIRGVGTTGSGRELIGILIGADTINDEITAHKTGALHISRTMLGREVDTIFEIGGQDSKYISVEDGVVVDFTMNDACAAGTGSFLEEQAEDLDVSIIDEFAELALSSVHPIRMGERCTVFMGRDVNSFMQRGASKRDVIAGLAFSVVHNYLNRIVRDRKIGNTIFFQGGTAYNDSVAAAFAKVTGKEIIVPPYNGVIGAIGEALLAKRKMESTGMHTTFRGYDISKINYELREFTCKGCTNFCTVQEFNVDGEKTYWGDKCSERYRKRKKIDRTPVIGDLFKIHDELLRKSYVENGKPGPVIGIPYTMYTYDQLPFFNVYLTECGFCTVVSDPTNTIIANKGIESIVAEACYPVTIAHGHIRSLFDQGVEFIWNPNIINAETDITDTESYICVWGTTLPFVTAHTPTFHPHRDRFLQPTVHFRDGVQIVKRELYDYMKRLGVSRKTSDQAVNRAYKAQNDFRMRVIEEGGRALDAIQQQSEKAIVLIGRPYNIYDQAVNLSVASKLAGIYGINVIPLDFIDVRGISISHIHDNMYWNYGRKILQTAVRLSEKPNFDIIYITNFKCGPDSFIKQFIREALGRPFLVLQFDGHSNDAGMMTRCEAYLDSKGFLSM